MIRLFVALIIPEEIRNQIIKIRQSIFPDESKFRWEDDSKIHLTLKFIGEVDENMLQLILDELGFLNDVKKIKCGIEKFGFFFRERDEPRILWLGLKMDDAIYPIVEELNQRLSKFSIPVEKRKFKAHLTLLRIKEIVSKNFIEKFLNAELPKITFTANEIVLMQSKLTSHGSTYKEIQKYYLK